MTQFSIQVDSDGKLIKSYTVTEEYPVRTADQVPVGRLQLVIEDKTQFDEIVSKYTQYNRGADYTYNIGTKELTINDSGGSEKLTFTAVDVIDKRI